MQTEVSTGTSSNETHVPSREGATDHYCIAETGTDSVAGGRAS